MNLFLLPPWRCTCSQACRKPSMAASSSARTGTCSRNTLAAAGGKRRGASRRGCSLNTNDFPFFKMNISELEKKLELFDKKRSFDKIWPNWKLFLKRIFSSKLTASMFQEWWQKWCCYFRNLFSFLPESILRERRLINSAANWFGACLIAMDAHTMHMTQEKNTKVIGATN